MFDEVPLFDDHLTDITRYCWHSELLATRVIVDIMHYCRHRELLPSSVIAVAVAGDCCRYSIDIRGY